MMSPFSMIEETLKLADNEGTDSPYWLIIDPSGRNIKTKADDIAHCITGPFFSREDADLHLKNRRYNFSGRTEIWALSGYWSSKYKNAYRDLKRELGL